MAQAPGFRKPDPGSFCRKQLVWSRGACRIPSREKADIDSLLAVREVLGTSATAIVESVQCRRILLARKVIRCSRRMKRSEALKEVKHLKRLQHPHVVRLVGTYTYKQDFAILLYPAAEYNLETFMDSIIAESPGRAGQPDQDSATAKLCALTKFFGCLSRALDFIHGKVIKHMDIKPKNLLIKKLPSASGRPFYPFYKVYIADFGISRSYKNASDAETDSLTSFTRMYAAPEVLDRDRRRGLSADVFSLGCIFIEMLGMLTAFDRERKRDDLMALLQSNDSQPGRSYQGNLEVVTLWLREVVESNTTNLEFRTLCPHPEIFIRMIHFNPKERPSARELSSFFGVSPLCCGVTMEPEAFAVEDVTLNSGAEKTFETVPSPGVILRPKSRAPSGLEVRPTDLMLDFLESERLYVRNLQDLQSFQIYELASGKILKPTVLPELGPIIDFHQKFLIEIEQQLYPLYKATVFTGEYRAWGRLVSRIKDELEVLSTYIQSIPISLRKLDHNAESLHVAILESGLKAPGMHENVVRTLLLAPALRLLDYRQLLNKLSTIAKQGILTSSVFRKIDNIVKSNFIDSPVLTKFIPPDFEDKTYKLKGCEYLCHAGWVRICGSSKPQTQYCMIAVLLVFQNVVLLQDPSGALIRKIEPSHKVSYDTGLDTHGAYKIEITSSRHGSIANHSDLVVGDAFSLCFATEEARKIWLSWLWGLHGSWDDFKRSAMRR
ncbi:kinase-like protein [Lophium mytilinum]|uniref:non-specific serine/threonine protein kinase n=1 Tax=Lophium mytilinum TaxID=390894 RepID=A0A6A6RGS8_9PEZI|nr:kinase-like protein [Lophium mytilinum]